MPSPFSLSEYEDYIIRRLVEMPSRRGSGQNNCSGYNLWNWGRDNMTVIEYQKMIETKCDKSDPQYDKSKHLKYDLDKGFVELVHPNNFSHNIQEDIEEIINDSELESTEQARLVSTRIGQGQYRKDLLSYWGRCAVTNYSEPSMLVASHIKPWSCSTNIERLDKFNGLLLIPTIDRAFDQGYITFSTDGEIMISSLLKNSKLLGIDENMSVTITAKHEKYMVYHRAHVFKT